jgi:uncharacterized protein
MTAVTTSRTEDATVSPPLVTNHRWMAVDSLRGLALLGVIVMNIGAMAMRFGGLEIASDAGPVGLTAMGLDLVFIQGKARACFALLFGFGVATLMSRAGDGENAGRAHVRRMAVLFGIGLFNQVFLFWGDILVLYALLGLVAGVAINWPKRRLLTVGLTLALLPPLALGSIEAVVGHPLSSPFGFDEAAQAARGLAAATGSSYADAIAFNATQAVERRLSDPFGMLVYDLGILGLILIGMWVARRGVFADIPAHRTLLRRVAIWCLPIGIVLSGLTATRLAGVHAEGVLRGAVTAAQIAFPVLAFGYLASLALVLSRRTGPLQRLILAPAGRMTLTNYLASGAIGGWVFYGYGLGLMSAMNLTMLALLPVALFIVLALASHLWLRRFRHGPAEWLWRSLASGKLPTPARTAAASGSGADGV